MRFVIPLFLLLTAACGDDTTTPPLPQDAAVGVDCGASTVCKSGELCCPGFCGDPVPFCSAGTSCPEASCDLGRPTD
jgi:hypothetical protein